MDTRRRQISKVLSVIPAFAALYSWPDWSPWASNLAGAGSRDSRIADTYATRFPEEDDLQFLTGVLPDTPAALADAISRDFELRSVVDIEGWILSRTECRYMLHLRRCAE